MNSRTTMKQHTGRLLIQTLWALVGAAALAVAGPSLALHERITVHIDGSADIALVITRQGMPAGPILIPCAYAGIHDLTSPDSGVVVRLQEDQDIRFFRVEAGEQEGRPVTIRMVVPRYADWEGMKRADFGNMTLDPHLPEHHAAHGHHIPGGCASSGMADGHLGGVKHPGTNRKGPGLALRHSSRRRADRREHSHA